jgi:hypothetical protein
MRSLDAHAPIRGFAALQRPPASDQWDSDLVGRGWGALAPIGNVGNDPVPGPVKGDFGRSAVWLYSNRSHSRRVKELGITMVGTPLAQ